MSLLDQLERRLRRFAVPHVTLGIIMAQVAVFAMGYGRPERIVPLYLVPDLVLEGEWWRVLSFLIVPPFGNILCAFFGWYLFYLMGTSLEHHWGVLRYNLYLLVGYGAAVAASFVTPDMPSGNAFLQASVFLAFAHLYPDFEICLFFFLPVKIKWLALLSWLGYGAVLIFGDWTYRAMVLGSILNFLLFFAPDLIRRARYGHRRMASQARRFSEQNKPFHRCTVCGITDKTHPQTEFRYCSKCAGNHGYCVDHLRSHEHIVEAGTIAEG